MMKKFGSDPEGSRVNNLERAEAENKIKSIVFGAEGEKSEVQEELPKAQLHGDKDWTPVYGDGQRVRHHSSRRRADKSE